MIKVIFQNIKARFVAVKYNIWTEKIDTKRKRDFFFGGDWYANGKLYYGHPLFVFFESSQNVLQLTEGGDLTR